MKTLFLLIVLTRNGAGDINASFVNTETLEQCQQKSLMLEGVFTGSNIPIVERQCIKSELRFSEFSHAVSSNMIRNFYLVEFNKEKVKIEEMESWRVCHQQIRTHDNDNRRYCSSSVQTADKVLEKP